MRRSSHGTIQGVRHGRGLRRRGVALVMVILMVSALGGLVTASIFLMSNAELFTRAAVKEANLRNAADAGLQMARSRVDRRGSTVPPDLDTLYWESPVEDALGNRIPGVTVNVYVGQSGSSTGQFGRFLSLVAEAKDSRGHSFVRRSELTQESFAKFAYWTDIEKLSDGTTVVFMPGNHIRGPAWSNDVLTIYAGSPPAKFWDDVGTAKTIDGVANGEFVKGYKINQKRIELPPNAALAKLAGYAGQAGYSILAPNSGNETSVLMRLEFVAANLNPGWVGPGFDSDSTDANEGFFRVFTAAPGKAAALRADEAVKSQQCGDWHNDAIAGRLKFYPVSVHNTAWFRAAMIAGGMTPALANAEATLSFNNIMAHAGARCYPAGDPHLVAVERRAAEYPLPTDREKGGEDTTFTPVGTNGSWRQFAPTQPVNPTIAAARPWDGRYLHPLHRSLNPGVKGVIHVKGTVAVSGVVRGRLTLYTEAGNLVIIDDIRYANDPGSGSALTGACQDMLGVIGAKDIVVADNTINTPLTLGSTYRSADDTKDLFVHGVMMALNQSFRTQNWDTGPTAATTCEAINWGRGCLYLTGGIIQVRRGAIGSVYGHGLSKRYSYDRCAAESPPPYFPVTGRYIENVYLEIDPANFDVVTYFRKISPTQ